MNNGMLSKTLAVAVIILFIGMGVQSTIAKPDIINLIPNNIDKIELTKKLNNIWQNYEHLSMLFNLINKTIRTSFIIGVWFIWQLFLATMWILFFIANWNNWP